MIIIIILFSTFMTRSSWNILLQHRTQIDNLSHLHFTSQRLSHMYKTVNFQFRPTLSFPFTKILSRVLIQFLSKESETPCVCVCVWVSERQRERERMENLRMLSLFLCFGFLGLCHAIESPQYTVVHSESDFEIRLYRQSTWMSAQSKDISFERATKFGFHRYYYFLLKPCWFWVILGTLFFVWWENEGKQNRNQSKVLGFSLGLCLFFCFVFWGLICSAESDISGWFNRGEISSFWLVAEKL